MVDKRNPQPARPSRKEVEDAFAYYLSQVEAAPTIGCYCDCAAAPTTGEFPAAIASLPPEDDDLIDLSDGAPAAEA